MEKKAHNGCSSNTRWSLLSPKESDLLQHFLVPTFAHGADRHHWNDAERNKDAWILKHRVKGKSEQVHAGCVTDEATWKDLFASVDSHDMILQPMIRQRRFQGRVGHEQRNDYVAGTLLYFNDQFFGPGIYRASSFPVTNQGDDRKLAQWVADVAPHTPGVHCL
jgi:hypothetical protein